MMFGGIKYVKGCVNYASCTPDPTTCYPFIVPASACQDLISGVQSTYFSATNTYISDSYDYSLTFLSYGYDSPSLDCQINSQSAACSSFGLSSSAGAIYSQPTSSISSSLTCDITIQCSLVWRYSYSTYCPVTSVVSPTITLTNSISATCISSVCFSGNYSLIAASAYTSYIAYQNSGISNSFGLASVPLSQYFNFPGSCNFDSCALVSAVGTSTSQGTIFTGVTATYSGSGSSARVIFYVDTTSLIAPTSLFLSCAVSAGSSSCSTCSFNQFFVYSSSSITFQVALVNSCYAPLTHSGYSYIQAVGTNIVVQATNFISSSNPTNCPLSSCQILDSSMLTVPSSLTLTLTSGLSYNLHINLATVQSMTLIFQCIGVGGVTLNSNTFPLTISSPCTASACATGSYSYIGTSTPSSFSAYQYSGSYNSLGQYQFSQSSVLLSQYFNYPSSSCQFSDCSLVSAVGTSTVQGTLNTQFTASISGTGSSQQVIFQVNTASTYSGSLYLSCTVPSAVATTSTCAFSQFYVYSQNQISFNVVSCYLPQTPASYAYKQYYLGGSVSLQIQVSSFMILTDATCTLTNCALVDSTGASAQSISLIQLSSSLYQIEMDTSQPVRLQTQYYQCKGFNGIILKSDPFTFQVELTCVTSSTTIKAPSNIRNIYYIVNQPGTLSQITISNFTSTISECPIFKHQLVVNQSSTTAPTYVKIQEGNSSFTISNLSMAWLANTYTFYIQAQALGGAVLNQQISIQIINDCNLDSIQINPVFPNDQEQMVSSYKTVNQLPVLIVNTTNLKPISVDISKRISNIFSSSCHLLQYKISKAIINSQVVDISTFGNYFTLSSRGVFQTLSTSPSTIINSLVYIQASNNQVWGGDQQQYLIDVTIIEDQVIQFSSPQSNPSQQDLSKNENQSSQIKSQSQQNGQNSQNYQQDKIKNQKNEYKFNFNNFKRPHGSQKYKVKQDNQSQKNKPLPVYFSKITINKKGLMHITFNQDLQVPDFARLFMQLKQNQSQNNKTKQNQTFDQQFNQQIEKQNISQQNILNLQSVLAFSLTVNSLQDQSLLEFKIQLYEWTSKGLSVLLNFENPTLVSSGAEYDLINIQVLNGSDFTSANRLLPMDEFINGYNQTKIQPQQPSFISEQMVSTIESNSQTLTIAIIVIQVASQVLMKANMELLYKLFLNMQMQQSLPIYQVNIPYKSQLYIDTDRSIVEFEFIKPQKLIKKFGLNFDLIAEDRNTPSNAQRLGMTSTSMLDNMMIYLFIVGLLVLMLILISLLFIFPCIRQKIIDFVKDKIKKFRWNGLLRGITVSYLKLSLGLSIQIQSERNNFNNQDIIILIQQFGMLAFLVGYIVFTQIKLYLNLSDFKNPDFQQEYGFLVKGQKLQRIDVWKYVKFSNLNVIFIYPSFLLYRLTYSMVPCIFYNQPGIQVQILLLITLAYIYIQVKMKTQLSFTEYYIDMFSEFMLLIMQMHMFWFIDGGILNGTPNQVSQENYLWFQSVADSSFMACGLSIIAVGLANFAKYITQQLINLYNKKKNLQNHEQNLKNKKNVDKKDEEISNLQKKENILKNAKLKLKLTKAEQKQTKIDILQIQNKQNIQNQQILEKIQLNFRNISQIMKENIKQQEMGVSIKFQSQENQQIIRQKLPIINASTKLKSMIRNPKTVNKIGPMSEIWEANTLDELSEQQIDQNDIDQIELKNLQEVCQKYEFLFNSFQCRLTVDLNSITKKELILHKYSILQTDSKNEIEIKMKMLLYDILSNDHLFDKLSKPLETFQMFENEIKEYYENIINLKFDK